MKEFLMKVISDKITVVNNSKQTIADIKITKDITSDNTGGIEISIHNTSYDNKTYVLFSKESYGEDYLKVAQAFCDALQKIINEPCNLPEVTNERTRT